MPQVDAGTTRNLRTLVLSRPGPTLGESRGPTGEVVERDSLDGAQLADGSFDRVVIREWLQYQRWDRWALQRVHRLLKPQGELLLRVPSLLAPFSPRAIAYASRKLGEPLMRRVGLGQARGPGSFPAFRDRRYKLTQLIATLESLGFDFVGAEPVETGLAGWFGKLSPALGGKYPDGWNVTARRKPSLFGIDPERPFPEPSRFKRKFEAENREYLERRDQWLNLHPEFRPGRAAPLDPGAYRGRQVLVLSPHPDDEIIGCGGTLSRLITAEVRARVIQATDGSEAAGLWGAPESVRRTVRMEEARAVAKSIGFSDVTLWGQDNAAFRSTDELVDRLRTALETLQPELIFSPWIMDIHPDHLTFNRILASALESSKQDWGRTTVLSYEVWGLAPINTYCVMTDRMQQVEQLLLLYEVAMRSDDYVHSCERRNYFHGLTQTGGPCFAEGFFAVPAPKYPSVVRTAEA